MHPLSNLAISGALTVVSTRSNIAELRTGSRTSPSPENLQSFGESFFDLFNIRLTRQQMLDASQGRLPEGIDLQQVVETADDWQKIKGLFLQNPQFSGLNGGLLQYRLTEVNSIVDTMRAEGIMNDSLMVSAPGSTSMLSDYDITFVSVTGDSTAETRAVERFNELFQQRWQGKNSGVLFDTNAYTRGHMRTVAYGPDAERFRLVNDLYERVQALRTARRLPTPDEAIVLNRQAEAINQFQGATSSIETPLPNTNNFRPFSDRVRELREQLSDTLSDSYLAQKAEYGTGAAFDRQAEVMGYVQQREFWQNQTVAGNGSGEISAWSYTQRRLNRTPDDMENFRQADEIYTQLTNERSERIQQLSEQKPHEPTANLEAQANEQLYIEYAQQADAKEANVETMRASGSVPEADLLELQDLRSRSLFFANEAYIPPSAAEHVVLNMQSGYRIAFSVQDYAISINSQIAFVGEKIAGSNDNFGRALWGSSKYLGRVADATERIQAVSQLQTRSQRNAISSQLYQETKNLGEYAEELTAIKKNENLTNLQRDQSAESIAGEHPDLFGTTINEFAKKVLDLQVNLQLEIQRYLSLSTGQ